MHIRRHSFSCRRFPHLEIPAAPRRVHIISACFPKPSEDAPLPAFYSVTVVQCLQSDSCHYWNSNRSFYLRFYTNSAVRPIQWQIINLLYKNYATLGDKNILLTQSPRTNLFTIFLLKILAHKCLHPSLMMLKWSTHTRARTRMLAPAACIRLAILSIVSTLLRVLAASVAIAQSSAATLLYNHTPTWCFIACLPALTTVLAVWPIITCVLMCWCETVQYHQIRWEQYILSRC